MTENLNKLAKAICVNAHNKGFYNKPETEDQYIERACNNLHDEVSELHTAWRNNELRYKCTKGFIMEDMGLRPLTNLEEELADIIIRALDNAYHLGVDIEEAVLTKMKFNMSRPYRHGQKRS